MKHPQLKVISFPSFSSQPEHPRSDRRGRRRDPAGFRMWSQATNTSPVAPRHLHSSSRLQRPGWELCWSSGQKDGRRAVVKNNRRTQTAQRYGWKVVSALALAFSSFGPWSQHLKTALGAFFPCSFLNWNPGTVRNQCTDVKFDQRVTTISWPGLMVGVRQGEGNSPASSIKHKMPLLIDDSSCCQAKGREKKHVFVSQMCQ